MSRVLVEKARLEALEATLESVWSNACETCGRPMHPRAVECMGCKLDLLRAELCGAGYRYEDENMLRPNEGARG